ncbi:MAG: DUF2335 domain-containing protein [Sphingomonadales bacterium]|nr:DUF2335 domain-containing protein [Sphingomonadales bacterium]
MTANSETTDVEADQGLSVQSSPVAGEVLGALPPSQREAVLTMAASMYLHSGPLPDPETLAAYDAIHPGATRELLNGARDNRRHRHEMERRIAFTARLSLVLTFFLMLAALGAATWLGANGAPWLAALFGVAGIGGVVATMIRGGGNWTGNTK